MGGSNRVGGLIVAMPEPPDLAASSDRGLITSRSMALAIYGTIAAGLALAIGADAGLGTWAVITAVLAELLGFFLAHAYADMLGEHLSQPGTPLWKRFEKACSHDVLLLVGGLPLVVVFMVETAAGLNANVGADIALALLITLLGTFGDHHGPPVEGRLAGGLRGRPPGRRSRRARPRAQAVPPLKAQVPVPGWRGRPGHCRTGGPAPTSVSSTTCDITGWRPTARRPGRPSLAFDQPACSARSRSHLCHERNSQMALRQCCRGRGRTRRRAGQALMDADDVRMTNDLEIKWEVHTAGERREAWFRARTARRFSCSSAAAFRSICRSAQPSLAEAGGSLCHVGTGYRPLLAGRGSFCRRHHPLAWGPIAQNRLPSGSPRRPPWQGRLP